MRNNVAVAAAVASAFIVLALAGSFFTSHKMNRTAEEHAMSAGRLGEATSNATWIDSIFIESTGGICTSLPRLMSDNTAVLGAPYPQAVFIQEVV